jgi:hypothetical protein
MLLRQFGRGLMSRAGPMFQHAKFKLHHQVAAMTTLDSNFDEPQRSSLRAKASHRLPRGHIETYQRFAKTLFAGVLEQVEFFDTHNFAETGLIKEATE